MRDVVISKTSIISENTIETVWWEALCWWDAWAAGPLGPLLNPTLVLFDNTPIKKRKKKE